MRLRGTLAAGGAALLASLPALAQQPDLASRISAAARAFSDSLDAEQHHQASYGFDDDERFDLRLAPLFLDGLSMQAMEPRESELLLALVASGLSAEGFAKVEAIRSLETEVRRLDEEAGLRGWVTKRIRDPRRYLVAFFGAPGDPAFGFRFDGHHVSLNVTVVPGAVPSATPLFLGAQPRRVREGSELAGLQVLQAEEDSARELLRALSPGQRERALLPFEADRGLFQGAGRTLLLEGPPAGLPRAAMQPAQQAKLDAVIDVYLGNVAPEIAAARRAAIDASGRDAIHFAWAGSDLPGEPHYYQVRGPRFLIEFDNTEAGADHIHTLWRDLDADFGQDLLAEHRRREHP
jgi:hypothetical protein